MATRRPRLAARNPAQAASGAGPPGPAFAAGSPWQGQQRVGALEPHGCRGTAREGKSFSVSCLGACMVLQLLRPNLGPEFCIPEVPRNYLDKKDVVKAPKSRQNGTLLVFDPKEKVIDPSKAMSHTCCFGRRPRLTSKFCSSPAQISLGVANTFSAKKETSSKTEDKVSLKSTENRPSSQSIENKDVLTNQQSDPWSSSLLKESAGESAKDSVLAKQEKKSEHCLQDIEEKLSDSTDGDGEEDTNDEDDEGPSKKETRAPLELMAEFLRAEMGQDYQLAKKLCQMILIYEPENPVAKEFFLLIEEILLKEKGQKHEEDEEDSDEDTSSESEEESSEDGSEDSSDECEDGS